MNIDPMYEKAMNFAKNFQQHTKSVGLSNVYVILRKDKNENVLDEHYGMNLMTDYGMQQFFTTSSSFPTNLYVGNGDGILGVSGKTLLSPLSETAATVSSSTVNYAYPLYFSSGDPSSSGIITASCKKMIVYLPYTFDSYTTPFAISEYGIGTSVGNLWTHSWVYTDTGERTTVTKNPNEKLEFHVFFCMSYYDSMINDAWNAGKYIVITTMNRFINRMIEDSILRFKRNNVTQSCTKTNTNTGFSNETHMITQYTNLSEFTLTTGTSASTGYMDGLVSWSSGFCMVERELKPTTEPVDSILYPLEELSNSDESLTACFGDANKVPITQMNIQHSYTFDHTTGGYTCEEQFTTTNDKWYTETTMDTALAVPIYYTTNNTITPMYVYQNLRTTDPIIRIDGNVPTVYATDTYWDTSSWVFISDHNNIPVSERNRKYWISSSSSVSLKPVRGNIGYRINQPNGLYSETMEFLGSFVTGYCDCDSSVSDNLFTMREYLYDINRYAIYRIHTSGDSYTRSFIQNGKVVLFNTDGVLRVASYTEGIGWSTTTYNSIAGISNYASNSYITNADNMIVILDANGKMERVANGEFVAGSNETGITAACAILRTENSYAFIRTSDPYTIHFYGDNASTETTFTLPSGIATPKLMYGVKNNLYVTNGSSYMYHIDTSTGVVNACNSNITSYNITSNFYKVRISSVGDIMLVYLFDTINGNYTYFSDFSNPTRVTNINGIFRSMRRDVSYYLRLMKWNNTYVLVENSYYNGYSRNVIYDFSQYMYDGTSRSVYISTSSPMIPFGNRLIHQNQISLMVNYIPHRVTGTTRTITTLNNSKNIRSKQWALSFTNTPSFQGLPPGTQQ